MTAYLSLFSIFKQIIINPTNNSFNHKCEYIVIAKFYGRICTSQNIVKLIILSTV